MWFVFALLTFFAWGTADLFYKKGAVEEDRYSHLKTTVAVGLCMGAAAVFLWVAGGVEYDPINLLLYLPVSALYILSMTVGYFGLRYLELSVSSPIQNASGAVSCLMMVAVLRKLPALFEGVAVLLITAGVVGLGILEKKKENALTTEQNKKYKIGFVAFLMPIFYCIIDSLGTALDGIYLDSIETTPLRNVTEESMESVANISYMLTFALVALVLFLYIFVIRGEKIRFRRQRNRSIAAFCETAGQLTYVYAMSGNGMVAAPLIASYCVFSVILARIFLHERLSRLQYAMVLLVFSGILVLGILEGISE